MATEEVKELPPIVMISEAQFIAKQLDPAWEEVAGGLAADVETLDKAQTKALADKAIAREELKDEEFTPFFEQMPKHEEDKEPISFEDAKECVLRYAVSIKMIPTRLKTALELYSDEFTKPERQMYDFFKNDSLTDVTLIHPTTGALYKAHRVIVASGSRYMLEVFMKHSVEDLPRVRVPPAFNQKNEMHSDDQVSRILKYIYGNQNIGLIRDEISEENFYSLYAQAYALGCERLLEDLRILAQTSLLNERTALKLYLDAVEHKEVEIMEMCSQVITERFQEICEREEAGLGNLFELDIENFINILKEDKLNILAEEQLIEVIRRYIDIREKTEPKKPESAEEKATPELWALLTEEEKENRRTAFQEEQDQIAAVTIAEMENDAAVYFEKDTTDRLQHVLDIKQKERNLKLYEQSLKQKLTDEQKLRIFRTIRYAYLPQEVLLQLSTDPDFALAKELIVQGLAFKLGGGEQFKQEDLKINLTKRDAMRRVEEDQMVAQNILDEPPLEVEGAQLNQIDGVENASIGESLQSAAAPQQKKNIGRHVTREMGASVMGGFPSERLRVNNELHMREKERMNQSSQHLGQPNPRAASPHTMMSKRQTAMPNAYSSIANRRFNDQIFPQLQGFQPSSDFVQQQQRMSGNQRTFAGNRNQSIAVQMLEASLSQNMNPLTGMQFSQSLAQKASLNSKPPQRITGLQSQQATMQEVPQEFFFDYNFDENGVLYYLGSAGKRRNWQNPHQIGQVQAFASTLGAGCSLESFVGRSVQNCRTEDEPYSFFGVDLGGDRRLVPTHYTLRNRNSPSHVLRNWYFEGSATGSNWVILDARIYHSESQEQNHALEAEFRDFQKKGGAMTFQIDTEIYRKLGFEGYRFFRVVQVGKNTHGTDNLALSGFELYGRVLGGPWTFHL